MSDSFKSERFSSGSLDGETSFDVSSYDVLLYDDTVRCNCAVSSVLVPSETIRDVVFRTSLSLEIEVDALNREEAQNFIKTYHTIYGLDPSDDEIKDHLVCGTLPTSVDWLNPSDIFQTNEIPLRSIELVGQLMQANIVGWTLK